MISPYGQLYRLAYLRDGAMRGITFFAADLADALAFEEAWEQTAKVKVLTMKEVGRSRFVERKGRVELRKES